MGENIVINIGFKNSMPLDKIDSVLDTDNLSIEKLVPAAKKAKKYINCLKPGSKKVASYIKSGDTIYALGLDSRTMRLRINTAIREAKNVKKR